MHRLWKVQSPSSPCPFSFIFSTPNGPRQEGHESQSAPTLALKSPRSMSCSVQGMFLMMDVSSRRTHPWHPKLHIASGRTRLQG